MTMLLKLPATRNEIGDEGKNAGSVNNYATFSYLKILRGILSDSLFTKLENTFLGPIIKAGSRRGGGAQIGDGLGFSGRLVHFLISRQILTSSKNELWFYFNGQPLRFSLREFHLITGLPCLETEDEVPIEEEEFKWPLCNGDSHSVDELIAQIKALGEDAEEGKLRLAMLVIIESIFLVPYSIVKYRFPAKYLDIAKSNIKSYPWGKDSFQLLIKSVNNVKSGTLRMDVKGFPVALHLWLLASVPKLEDAYARLDKNHSDWFICARYASTQQLAYAQIWDIEESKDAKVTCVLSSFSDAEDLSVLLDEEEDDLHKVMDLVNRGYNLTECDWRRKFIEIEKAEEFISQMQQEDQFQEVEFSEMLNEGVGDDLDKNVHCHVSELEEEVQAMHFQDVNTSSSNAEDVNTSSSNAEDVNTSSRDAQEDQCKTSLETDIDLPLKRKRDTAGTVLDACAIVTNGDDCVMSSDGIIPAPSGCINSDQPETCSICEKQQKPIGDSQNLSVCSCSAQPVEESDHMAQDMKETGPAMDRDHEENRQMYPEYWVPVQLSNVQLDQYCRTLFSKSLSLSSLSKDDLGSLEETLNSVRKTCDHPYVMDVSLKQLLTKNLELHEMLDVEVKASGKLHLLDAMLTHIKKNGLKAVVFYQQATQSPEGLLLGNILEDFVAHRFGKQSYEHGTYSSNKKNAINNFNKENQCCVLLLETRACSQSIKLLRAEAFILFGSNWNPFHDIKHLEKIKIESYSERTKIYRLYSVCTVEEKALILARQNKWQNKRQNKTVENLNRTLTHALLMWGASYLFDKLEHFHSSETPNSGVPFDQSIMDGVIHEFSSVLSSKGGEENAGKLCLLLEAKHAQGTYSTDSTLFGEEHIKLSDEDSPNIFWTKLLGGKNPMWKYPSDTPQRNRKRVKYFEGSEESPKIGNGGNTKKRKKASDNVTDPPVDNDERNASGKDQMGASESPKVVALQSSCKSTSGSHGTFDGNDAFGMYSIGGHISGIPEDMLAGHDWRKIPLESQKRLHAVLKLEMAKLCQVLHVSEAWTSMVEKFLEYVIENHRIYEEPATTYQAFQIALIWIAALLVKQKFSRKESIIRAKSELAFNCSREEINYIYSIFYCMKSLFLERTQGLQLDRFGTYSKQSMVCTKQVNESLSGATVHQEKNNTKLMRSSEGEECTTEKRGSPYSTATIDIEKTISDIKRKCKKHVQKLVQEHEKKKVELANMYVDKKQELETRKKVEAAVIRITCSGTSTQVDDLKRLDHEYERKFDEIKSKKDECLKSLEQMYEAAKKKLAEDEACWNSRIKNWAQAELGTSWIKMDVSTLSPEQATDNVATKSQSNEHISITVPEILIPAGCQEEFAALNVHLTEYQNRDRITSASPDEDVSPSVPEISQSFNLAKSGSPEFSLDREEALVTIENNRTTHVGSDADNILAQQNKEVCSLDKEIPDESALPMPLPASVVETMGSTESDQDYQDICPMPSSPTGKQPDPTANIQGKNIDAAVEPQSAGSETIETAGFNASNQAGNQPDPAANVEGQNIETSAEPHIAGPDAVESGDSVVSDQETVDAQDACYQKTSALVGTQTDLTENTEGQNITATAQLHTAGSDALETDGPAVSDQGVRDASPLPFSYPGNHTDAAVNTEGSNNTTVAEPRTTGSDACEMEIAEPGTQVEQSTLANLFHEGGVELSAGVTVPVPSLLNNGMGPSAVQPAPQIPFPVFNDPFQYELEKLRRESETTKKTYEEKKSILKAEVERKMAEVQAEYQRKFSEVEAEHNTRTTEIETSKNLVFMNKLLANAFLSKCTGKKASHASPAPRGRIQQLAQRAAQVTALRNYTAQAPALAPALAPAPAPAQASSFPSVPRSSGLPLNPAHCPMPQPRQPLISNTVPIPSASPATTPVVNASLRSHAPHLNSYRPSSSIPIATATPTLTSLPQPITYSAVIIQQQSLSNGLQGGNDVVCLSDDE